MSRRLGWAGAAAIVAGAAAWTASVLWQAGAVVSAVRTQLTSEASFPVTVRPWIVSIPAGFESVGAPADYIDAQLFQNNLYIAGASGLTEYSAEGARRRRFRVGVELPPAPLTALAVGSAGDSSGPELWIATAGEGLVAFNGETFRHIRPERPEHVKITSLVPVSTGHILLGTEKAGVLTWDGSRLTQLHSSLAKQWVTALTGDDSNLWIGTLDQGLLHWNAGSARPVTGNMPDARVLSLALAPGHVYAGTAVGIADIQDNAVGRILAPGYFAQALLADKAKLWAGTLEEGMFEVLLSAGRRRGSPQTSPACSSCGVRKIFRVGDTLYTLTSDSLWKGSEEVLTRAPARLKDRNISAIALDSTGRAWIGYFDHGLQILDGDTTTAEFEDDHLFCINRIVHHPDSKITAVGTANGLVVLDASATRRRLLTSADGLIANQITDIAVRSDGALIAATPAGISFIDAAGIQSVYAFQGLVNNHVFALAADSERVLAGTLGGLSVMERGLVKASYTTANSALKYNWITAIRRLDREYFVGTYGGGVIKWTADGAWESFEDLKPGLEINANAMTVTSSAVYAGTLDRGLAVYRRSSGRWSFFTAGLPSRNVTAVDAKAGMVWIGTDNGLARVPEASLLP